MKKLIVALLILSPLVFSQKTFGQSNVEEKFITGIVTSVNVKGYGKNSAQLLFTVLNKKTGEQVAIMVTSYPDYEPQLFSSMSNFVTAAHFSKQKITAGYYTNPGETSRAIEVFSPPNSK